MKGFPGAEIFQLLLNTPLIGDAIKLTPMRKNFIGNATFKASSRPQDAKARSRKNLYSFAETRW